jgi:hypothetical protein
MFSTNFAKLVFLVLGSVASQVKAAALQGNTDMIVVNAGKFPVRSASTPSRLSPLDSSAPVVTVPWVPTEENLIFSPTFVQGDTSFVGIGWIFTPTEGDFYYDGF